MEKKLTRVWATQTESTDKSRLIGHPCIWGREASARENCDPYEVVVQIEYRVLKTIRPRKRTGVTPF